MGINSPYCLDSVFCLALYGDPPSDPQSQGIRNALSTEGYWDIYVEFDINTVGLTNGDSCSLFYSPNDGNDWILLNRYGPNDDGLNMEAYPDNDADDNRDFELAWVNAMDSSSKACYIDSIRIYGIPITPAPTGMYFPYFVIFFFIFVYIVAIKICTI